jgi:hypothetical protein
MNFFDAATGETYKGYKEEGYLQKLFEFLGTSRLEPF